MNGQIREVARKLSHSGRMKKLMAILIGIVIVLGLLIPLIEMSSSSPIITTELDGIYFAATTVTGVGYGDMVPVTLLGKIIAMILQTVGVVLFGSIVAFVSVELFRYQEDWYMRRVMERMDILESKMDDLKKHLDFLVKK